MRDVFVVTCEHGGNRIPAAYRHLFQGRDELLNSHRGYDAGALTMAESLAAALDAPILASTTSRLLIDLNRPPGHPRLFSVITRKLPSECRAEIACRYHHPHWAELRQLARQAIEDGDRVVHISSHSFTPVMSGRARSADVGLLYDPGRCGEVQLCTRWKATLADRAPELRVRRNYPYCGKSAGLTAQMRRCFSADAYVGIELEVNQSVVCAGGRRWTELRRLLTGSLRTACGT